MTQFLTVAMTLSMFGFLIIFWIWHKYKRLKKIHEVIPLKSKRILAWTKVTLIILLTNFISYLIVFVVFYMQKGG